MVPPEPDVYVLKNLWRARLGVGMKRTMYLLVVAGAAGVTLLELQCSGGLDGMIRTAENLEFNTWAFKGKEGEHGRWE